jgi:hypothetical protein
LAVRLVIMASVSLFAFDPVGSLSFCIQYVSANASISLHLSFLIYWGILLKIFSSDLDFSGFSYNISFFLLILLI